jgi:hypothetical protein
MLIVALDFSLINCRLVSRQATGKGKENPSCLRRAEGMTGTAKHKALTLLLRMNLAGSNAFTTTARHATKQTQTRQE